MIIGLIEPHKPLRELLTWQLEHKGHTIRQFEAISEEQAQDLDLLIIEPGPPEQPHPALHLIHPTRIIIQTAYGEYPFTDHTQRGALVLVKPYSPTHLIDNIVGARLSGADVVYKDLQPDSWASARDRSLDCQQATARIAPTRSA